MCAKLITSIASCLRDIDTKKVDQISILGPSICAATTFKNYLIVPLKATIFEKITLIEFYPLPPIYTTVAGRRSLENPCGRPQITR
jgi:hypothetical protein